MAVTDSIEKLIAIYMRRGCVRKLGLDESQASIAILKFYDANWQNKPHYQVIPGAVRTDGGGQGSQEGGSMIRVQQFSIVYYGQSKLDQHDFSDSALTDPTNGVMDNFEALRQLFAHTYFGDGTNFLLSEPLYFATESKPMWEDQANGVFSREFTWNAHYAVLLPGISLTLNDVTP